MDTTEQSTLEELPESECWRLLRSVDVGRLAMAAAERIEIFPVNFLVDHGTIVFRTAAGTKLTTVARTSEVAFEADNCDGDDGVAWSVVVKGNADKVEGRTDVFDVFDLDLRPWHDSSKPYFVRLTPTAITGRRFVRST